MGTKNDCIIIYFSCVSLYAVPNTQLALNFQTRPTIIALHYATLLSNSSGFVKVKVLNRVFSIYKITY